jgi:hypothetical protein
MFRGFGCVVMLSVCGCQQSSGLVEDCGDALDNDGDGATDCIDSDCALAAECLDSTPTTPTVHIEPESPSPGQGLICVVGQESMDEEGDDLDYQFTWTVETVDGTSATVAPELLSNEGLAYRYDTVLTGVTQPSETWTCSLVVSDGKSASDAVTDTVTIGASCSDLNCDGFPDIVFANFTDDNAATVESYVYYGTATGYSEDDRGGLASAGATGVSVDDLNEDGFQDIVFANHYVGDQYFIESGIFWGSSTGHSAGDRTGLPTVGAIANVVADVNSDGFKDILFVNRFDGSSFEVESYLYWGSSTGFSESDRLTIPVAGGGDAEVADLNGDGYQDIVIGSFYSYTSAVVYSYIFYGTASGIDLDNPTRLDTGGIEGIGIGDLDDDGDPELVFGGYYANSVGNDETKIFWNDGTDEPFGEDYTTLPSIEAYDVHIRDLDGDDYPDIIVANLMSIDSSELEVKSYIYWGSATGYSEADRTDLTTFGATAVESADLDQDGYLDLVFSSLHDGVGLDTNGAIFWGGAGGYTDADFTFLDIIGSFDLAIAGG